MEAPARIIEVFFPQSAGLEELVEWMGNHPYWWRSWMRRIPEPFPEVVPLTKARLIWVLKLEAA